MSKNNLTNNDILVHNWYADTLRLPLTGTKLCISEPLKNSPIALSLLHQTLHLILLSI